MKYLIEQLGLVLVDPQIEITIINGSPVIQNLNFATNKFDILVRLYGEGYSFDTMIADVQADTLNWAEEGAKLPGYVQAKIDEWVVDEEFGEPMFRSIKKEDSEMESATIIEPAKKNLWQKIFN
jgi:hypothetical protein